MNYFNIRLAFLLVTAVVASVWIPIINQSATVLFPSSTNTVVNPVAQPSAASGLDSGSKVTGTTADPDAYLEDQRCAACHGNIYQSYQQVGMALSFSPPKAERFIENFDSPPFFHVPSQRYYQMSRNGDALTFKRWQLDDRGQRINVFEHTVDYMLGSGHKARSYLYQTQGGEMFQLPIGWYSQSQQWGMSPGYDNSEHSGVTRPVRRECLFCHNAYPQIPKQSDNHWQPHTFPKQLPHGTGCQRCHGPGANHVQTAMQDTNSVEQIRATIVNPSKLEPNKRDSVCFQCHLLPSVDLVGVRHFARPDYSFRPGEDLNDYMYHMEVVDAKVKQSERFEINHHAYRLRQSQCFIKSAGQLGCIGCHNPHKNVSSETRATHYDRVCQSCHSGEHQPQLEEHRDCVSCHMPQRRTQDVVKVVLTDHKIQRNARQQDWLAPLEEQEPILEALEFLMPEVAPDGDLAQIYKVVTMLRAIPTANYVDYLQTLLARSQPKEIQPYLDLIKGQLSLLRYADAEKTARTLMVLYPDNFRIEQWLATALLGQQRYDEAAPLLESLVKEHPEVAEIHFNYALLQMSQDQLSAAQVSIDTAIALRENFVAAWYYRGEIAAQRSELAPAIAAYQHTLAVDPSYTRAYLGLAKALIAQGDNAQARRYLIHGEKVARQKEPITAMIAELVD